MKTLLWIALLAVMAASCAGGSEASTTSSPDVQQPSTTRAATVTTTLTPSVAEPAVESDALTAFRTWTSALYEGEYQLAWDLMAPSSQAALGGFDLFEGFGTEMTEGWGSWAAVEQIAVEIETDLAGRTLATFSGVVTREGQVEEADVKVFLVTLDGIVTVSPFEEFGNVAVGLAEDQGTVPLPQDSGSGRRIVYSNSDQRVWIVEDDGSVLDTYLVSGRQGVPPPGVYEVFSKSEIAYAGHDDITMRYMVRFTYAESGIAIGFHSIPNNAGGEPLQTEEQLGEFHSAGCVRQSLGQSAALYEWAHEGTIVHVLE